MVHGTGSSSRWTPTCQVGKGWVAMVCIALCLGCQVVHNPEFGQVTHGLLCQVVPGLGGQIQGGPLLGEIGTEAVVGIASKCQWEAVLFK